VERLAGGWCPVTEVPTASASSLVSRIESSSATNSTPPVAVRDGLRNAK
jgi:hypothetical protein